MADLTPEYYWCCESAKQWTMTVGKYTVRFGYTPVGLYQYDFSCECKGFKYRKKCKHIEEAKKHHCGWNQFCDGDEPKDGKCPKCSGPIFSQKVMV